MRLFFGLSPKLRVLSFQLLNKRVQDITQPIEEQSMVQGFHTKVFTVIQNLILTGEGEELVRGRGCDRPSPLFLLLFYSHWMR